MQIIPRLVAAFLLAPFGAFVAAWPSHVWMVLLAEREWRPVTYYFSDGRYFVFSGFVMSLIVGLPVLIILMRKRKVTALSIVGVGTVTGAVPMLVFGAGNIVYTALYFPDQLLRLPISDFTGFLLRFCTMGAVCGYLFWLVAFWDNPASMKYAPNKSLKADAVNGAA